MSQTWVTGDEHYGHYEIINRCERPFSSLQEMEKELINRHNEVVSKNDRVIHIGDFSFYGKDNTNKIISMLNGHHTFLKGDHDKKWLKGHPELREFKINRVSVICFHWPMLSWPKSFYGSIHLFAHCHGNLTHDKKAMDIGVDTNNFYPYSSQQIFERLGVML